MAARLGRYTFNSSTCEAGASRSRSANRLHDETLSETNKDREGIASQFFDGGRWMNMNLESGLNWILYIPLKGTRRNRGRKMVS